MPDQAIQDMRQAVPSTESAAWDVKLALDLGAAIVFTEIDFERLSRDAQEKALANGYQGGDPVMLGFTVERGQAPAFTLFGRQSVPDLELIRTTKAPRLAPESADRLRALRKAMPSLSEGAMEWAKAEFEGLMHPEHMWVAGADDIRIDHGHFGDEGVGTRCNGVGLLESRMVDGFAGEGASDWLGSTLEDGSVALIHSHRLDLYYLRGRAAPDRMLQALEQWWQSEPPPNADEAMIIAEPIEAVAAPESPEPAAPSSEEGESLEACWFCGGPADSPQASEVEMYAPESVQRTVEAVGAVDRYVATYQQLRVPVPRCENCQNSHDGETLREAGGTLLGLVAGGGGAFVLYRQGWIWDFAGSVAVWIGLAVVVIGAAILGNRFGAARGRARRGETVRPESANAEHPLVRQLLEEGYQLGKPAVQGPES